MTTPFRHPGYDPPDFASHIQKHAGQCELYAEGDLITACSICDPMIEADRYFHNKAIERIAAQQAILTDVAEQIKAYRARITSTCDYDDGLIEGIMWTLRAIEARMGETG